MGGSKMSYINGRMSFYNKGKILDCNYWYCIDDFFVLFNLSFKIVVLCSAKHLED